jgi:hypothetical protein
MEKWENEAEGEPPALLLAVDGRLSRFNIDPAPTLLAADPLKL